MKHFEVNFDGLVGPTHNYAGLSYGNVASQSNAKEASNPKEAAKQGLRKMKALTELGMTQGVLAPQERPDLATLRRLGFTGNDASVLAQAAKQAPAVLAACYSASSMWTANAATVSPAPDTADGRCHLTVANLVTMPHRSHEWPDTLRQLELAFADARHFAVNGPVPPCFGDEGAANHMRLTRAHGEPGLEIFVFGRSGGRFPARQHEQASRIVARRHGLDPARVLYLEQSPEAIAAGAFHNDVVAVANERVLLCHERAFAEPEAAYAAIRQALPEAEIVVVPESAVSLAEAVRSYLFNAQLLTLPGGGPALVIPTEAWESPAVRACLEAMIAGNGPIRRVEPVDVRQSMANGGGPACLRLRVVADPATVDPRFLLDERKAESLERIIARSWPEQIDPGELGDPKLAESVTNARGELLESLRLSVLG